MFKFLNGLEKWMGADLSFADYPPLAQLSPEKRDEVINYVQSFNAADYRQIGVHALAVQQHAEEEIGSDKIFRVKGGYDLLPEFVAKKLREAGGRIELSRTVERIEWQRGRVAGVCARWRRTGAIFGRTGGDRTASGRFAASWRGVRSGAGAADRLNQLAMGPVRRFTLLFRERWWAEHQDIQLPAMSFPVRARCHAAGVVDRAPMGDAHADRMDRRTPVNGIRSMHARADRRSSLHRTGEDLLASPGVSAKATDWLRNA